MENIDPNRQFISDLAVMNGAVLKVFQSHLDQNDISQDTFFARVAELDHQISAWVDHLDIVAHDADTHYSEEND